MRPRKFWSITGNRGNSLRFVQGLGVLGRELLMLTLLQVDSSDDNGGVNGTWLNLLTRLAGRAFCGK